jgi:hypothetical protein
MSPALWTGGRGRVFPALGTTYRPLPASEKLGAGVDLSVVSLDFGCQNPVDAPPDARGLRVTLRVSSSTIKRFWGDEGV